MVVSVLLYGAETWPELTPAQGRRLEAFCMRGFRRIAGAFRAPVPGVQRESDEVLRERLGVQSVHALVRQRRLTYLRGLLAVPQPAVSCLLDVRATPPVGWAAVVADDLRAVAAASAPECPDVDPALDWRPWCDWLLGPKAERGIRAARSYASPWPHVVYQEIRDISRGQGAGPGEFICTECPEEAARVFPSRKALMSHRARAHGHRTAARAFVIDNQCPCCGKHFRNRPAAIDHLAHRAARCRRLIESGAVAPCDAAAVAAADQADRDAGLVRARPAV